MYISPSVAVLKSVRVQLHLFCSFKILMYIISTYIRWVTHHLCSLLLTFVESNLDVNMLKKTICSLFQWNTATTCIAPTQHHPCIGKKKIQLQKQLFERHMPYIHGTCIVPLANSPFSMM